MSLQGNKSPLIRQGWIRAVLLLLVYIGLSATAGLFVPSIEIWITSSFVISFVVVYLFRRFIDRRSFSSLGFKYGSIYPESAIGFLTGLFLLCLGALVLYAGKNLIWTDILFKADDFFTGILLMLLVAFAEEIVFRGYVLRSLEKSFNQWIALPVSALFFTLVHLGNPGIPLLGILNIFLGGLLLGVSFQYTRNLWLPVFFHFSWNFFQGPVLGFPVSGLELKSVLTMELHGRELLTGGVFGFEGSIVCFILLLLTLLFYGYLHFKRYNVKPGV